MSNKHIGFVKPAALILLLGAVYALPAAASVSCPPGETPASKDGTTCVTPETAKPQVDPAAYEGAQKKEALACNKLNTAQGAVSTSSAEISRINTSLDEAYYGKKKATDSASKAAADAEIKKWKDLRSAEEAKLKTAKKDLSTSKKELRNAKRAVKKERKESLNCA